jgi:membrane associated rhomboid family serine protease
MKTVYRRPAKPLIPGYNENGALQLIVVTGVTFIIFHFTRIIMLVAGKGKDDVFSIMFPNIGLSNIETFKHKFWTIFTYGWVHQGFWDWLTNMIWVYLFASVLQTLAGYKQVIPLFFYSLLIGGGFYIGAQFIPSDIFHTSQDYFMGANAGVLALAVAALSMAPSYRLYLTPGFSIPLAVIVAVYVFLDIIVYVPYNVPAMMLCIGGAITGFVYSRLLRTGYSPGEFIYNGVERLQQRFTPDEAAIHGLKSRKRVEILRTMYEPKKGISQDRIDEILDKINDHGYHSLSREEKDILFRAGKD